MSDSSNHETEPTQTPSPTRQFISTPPNPSSSSKRINSLLSKVYKQASELYLTRRLPECLALLEHSVLPWRSIDENGDGDENTEHIETTLIGGASRSLRVKVWNLYLTLLNDIVGLGANEGRSVFGNKKWRELAASVQNGTVWDEVVKVGYRGVETSVDADVVANLSTLLLTQCSSQELNQDRLEGYFVGAHSTSLGIPPNSGSSMPHTTGQGYSSETEVSARSLRDLHSRIKLLELYALHVLPRNNQWQYAEEFVSNSDILDANTKESFLQTLDGLEKENHEWSSLEEPSAMPTKAEKEFDGQNPKLETETFHNQQGNVENDYGIEDVPNPCTTDRMVHNARNKSPLSRSKLGPPYRGSAVRKSSASKKITTTRYTLLATIQRVSHMMCSSLPRQPMLLIRFAVFMIGFIFAFSRRKSRERVTTLVGTGWEKLSRTAGMGMKVSYL